MTIFPLSVLKILELSKIFYTFSCRLIYVSECKMRYFKHQKRNKNKFFCVLQMPLERTAGTQIAQLFSGRFLPLVKLLLPWHLNTSITPLLLPVSKTHLVSIFSLISLSSSLIEMTISSRLVVCHLQVIGWMGTNATKCKCFMYIFGVTCVLRSKDLRLPIHSQPFALGKKLFVPSEPAIPCGTLMPVSKNSNIQTTPLTNHCLE